MVIFLFSEAIHLQTQLHDLFRTTSMVGSIHQANTLIRIHITSITWEVSATVANGTAATESINRHRHHQKSKKQRCEFLVLWRSFVRCVFYERFNLFSAPFYTSFPSKFPFQHFACIKLNLNSENFFKFCLHTRATLFWI